MRDRLTRPALALALALAILTPLRAAPDTATLSVHVTGFTHERGHVIAKLYAQGDDVLGPGRWTAKAAIHGNESTLQWPKLSHGRYAVVVFHDENDNGTLDHNLLRLPAEPLGFSNGFALSWRSGMPSFEKLQFEVTRPAQTIEVRVK